MKNYLVAYDIMNTKRASKVRRLVYSYALGGQKSVLELILSRRDLKEFLEALQPLLAEEDSINIVEIKREAMLFGKVDVLNYDEGVVIV